MPTDEQLRAEPWWGREIVTDELDWLADELCRRTGRPRTAAGTRGDRYHLNGAHRSQEWILNSRYCTNRSYTVQSGLTATQARHIAALDFTPGPWGTPANRALMAEQTGRLAAALKAGRLDGVREVIGTLDGRTAVGIRPDGSQRSADNTHLDHWHLTLDRRRCADRSLMERILAVALGEDDDMSWSEQLGPTTSTQSRWPQSPRQSASNWLLLAAIYAYDATRLASGIVQRLDALLAAQQGLDTAAIMARMDQLAAEERERDATAAAERAALLDLVRRGQAGEMDPRAVVDEIARRLTATPAQG